MFEFITMTKALSDENRVRILLALNHAGETCVCHLVELLQLAPSTVSKHLFILRSAKLVDRRKDGRWMYYRLNNDSSQTIISNALHWVVQSIHKNPVIINDRNRLIEILSDPVRNTCA